MQIYYYNEYIENVNESKLGRTLSNFAGTADLVYNLVQNASGLLVDKTSGKKNISGLKHSLTALKRGVVGDTDKEKSIPSKLIGWTKNLSDIIGTGKGGDVNGLIQRLQDLRGDNKQSDYEEQRDEQREDENDDTIEIEKPDFREFRKNIDDLEKNAKDPKSKELMRKIQKQIDDFVENEKNVD